MNIVKSDERINDWQRFIFQDKAFSFPVFKKMPIGVEHPPATIVMHEVPGIYPAVIDFAQRLLQAGYCVCMPSLMASRVRLALHLMLPPPSAKPASAGSFGYWR